MKNVNPLFLLEGKYLNKLLADLNKTNPDMVEQLLKNGVMKKGSALRKDIAAAMKDRMKWDHLSKARKQVKNQLRMGKVGKAESEALSKLAKGGQVDSMSRHIPGNQKSFNTAVKDTIKKAEPTYTGGDTIFKDIPDDSFMNAIRKWRGKPLKTHRVIVGSTPVVKVPPKTPYVFNTHGNFGADYVI